MQVPKEYREVVIKAAVVLALVVICCLIFLWPIYNNFILLSDTIAEKKVALERQKVFSPEYEKFQEMSAKGVEVHFPVPKQELIPIREIDQLPARVEDAAVASGLSILDVVISPGSLKNNQGRLMLQAVMTGSVPQFREFYQNLCAQGFVAYVARVGIQATSGALEFFVEFWVHIEDKRAPGQVEGA
ncbi:MAG: hypothetical protein KKB70_05955 [Proteobacteria bacterium]|nr:hypothetical protein [Pseudomonadota bacterium]